MRRVSRRPADDDSLLQVPVGRKSAPNPRDRRSDADAFAAMRAMQDDQRTAITARTSRQKREKELERERKRMNSQGLAAMRAAVNRGDLFAVIGREINFFFFFFPFHSTSAR
jgi:hypothetical protein